MQALFELFILLLAAYVVVHAIGQVAISALTYGIIANGLPFRRTEVAEFLLTGLEPPISLLVPAYNEALTIVGSVRSILQLRYADYEIIVVNDGSRDATLGTLTAAFELEPFPLAYHGLGDLFAFVWFGLVAVAGTFFLQSGHLTQLALLCAIVVSGAAVRLTGSGLGCDDWPRCNSSKLIDVSSGHAAIEQINRLFTGLVSLGVVVAVLGSLIRVTRSWPKST